MFIYRYVHEQLYTIVMIIKEKHDHKNKCKNKHIIE